MLLLCGAGMRSDPLGMLGCSYWLIHLLLAMSRFGLN